MKIRPLHDRVVVRRIASKDKTDGGIIIPDAARQKAQEGEVVAVGAGARDEGGKLVPLDVKAGDRVLFGKGSGAEILLDGQDLLIMKESDIMWAESGFSSSADASPSRSSWELDAPPAFSAGPRARAILRGKEIAETDLANSGGSYSLEQVRRLLGDVSRQSVEKKVREGRLLAVIGPNSKRFYPVAQFHDDGSVIEGLHAVQDALATRNGYAVLNYLVNPDPRLDNRKPLDLLKQGEITRVVEAAARSGEQGA